MAEYLEYTLSFIILRDNKQSSTKSLNIKTNMHCHSITFME